MTVYRVREGNAIFCRERDVNGPLHRLPAGTVLVWLAVTNDIVIALGPATSLLIFLRCSDNVDALEVISPTDK